MWDKVPAVHGITRDGFYRDFVKPRIPVVLRGVTDEWAARSWGVDSFSQLPSVPLSVKLGDVSEGVRVQRTIYSYARALEDHERFPDAYPNPGYLHDVPIFRFFPELTRDVDPAPTCLLPKWYWKGWQEYAQFFMGPGGSRTPFHFDTLLTHNLFFHLAGKKRFTLIPAEQRPQVPMKSWRWADTEPEYFGLKVRERLGMVSVDLQPGDVLFMPSGTLHHVENLTPTVAFNIDWHTPDSARDGVLSVLYGAPWKNGYYNLLSYLGLRLGVPPSVIFPLYKSYLTYVS